MQGTSWPVALQATHTGRTVLYCFLGRHPPPPLDRHRSNKYPCGRCSNCSRMIQPDSHMWGSCAQTPYYATSAPVGPPRSRNHMNTHNQRTQWPSPVSVVQTTKWWSAPHVACGSQHTPLALEQKRTSVFLVTDCWGDIPQLKWTTHLTPCRPKS